MKINRFIAMAVIALLVVGAMGAISARSFAQTVQPQTQATEAPEASAQGPDTDNIDEQVGDQNAPDGQESDEGAEASTGLDTDTVQEGDQTGADIGADVNENNDGQDSVTVGTPAISAEAAQKTAEAYLNAGPATKIELDNEDGKLIYSVKFNGTDVKVDAMTGEVLTVETGQD
jgi:uncharacterized membrane protein YkoI